MISKRIHCLLATILLTLGATATAEDIDLFVQPAGEANGAPNVLIILDNTANWNDPFTAEMTALVDTFNSLEVNTDGTAKVRVGLMLFTESGGANKGEDGGYVRAAIRDLDEANQVKYAALVNSLDRLNDKSNGGKAGKTMADAYQYFSGLPPLTGNRKSKTDYTGNTFGSSQSQAIYALGDNALAGFNTTPYRSPVEDGFCGGNYIIYISNGPVQDNSSDNSTATGWLATAATAEGVTGATTAIPISPSGSANNVADEWARFMRKSSQKIVTYTIDVKPKTTGQTPGWTALLRSMAGVSDGKYFDGGSGGDIGAALEVIFSEIQAVNSVFASVSLPLSINSQGTYLNQVYVGMFRPDADALPRWNGNLKQYKLGIVNNELITLDADDASAINSSTGFITECARSFWSTADTYWSFRPQGGCIGGDDRSNSPDGNIVEKGAAAQRLRTTTTRNLRTCPSSDFDCSGGPVAFNNTTVSQADLGAASTADRDALINWQLGQDLLNEDVDAVTDAEMRASAHGDVVHSRPVAINFGTDASPKVVVFYSGNDGVLRAINGNRTTSIGSIGAGSELWSFVPPEFFGQIKRLRDNSTQVSYFGNTTTSPMPLPKPYGLDGPITAYTDADDTWVFVTARRGGRVAYGFDMTTIDDDPNSPDVLWKVGCPNAGNDTGCTTGFSDIGQTWSSAKPLATQFSASMLVMGGGYDPCEDVDPDLGTFTCDSATKGNRVYIMDAESGTLLNSFQTERAVPADIFVVPDKVSGLAKFAYAVDTGGNVYRISGEDENSPFGSSDPADWQMTKIADLGCATPASCAENRKFMFAPDVVENNGTYFLLLGSGDREKPLMGYTAAADTTNYFFMVKDTPTDPDWLSDEVTACGTGVMCLASLLEIERTAGNPDSEDLADKKGWYLELHDSEQVVTSAITVFGTTTFSTHTPTVPEEGSCESDLGTARVYNLRYLNAATRNGTDNRYEEVSGGGLPPSPVAGLVVLDGSSVPIPFIIGADPDSSLQGRLPVGPETGTQPKSLTYWFIEKED